MSTTDQTCADESGGELCDALAEFSIRPNIRAFLLQRYDGRALAERWQRVDQAPERARADS